ncbi:MAG TPA: 2,3-bisphosphoglycerate-independent phosphoglycerate mutase [Solirubrobacteraceae bacterium]|nr:2,3-bisphosphoglycerate-independent phosphoglycerate mutase [Solirubrobacteraceae bacterium]
MSSLPVASACLVVLDGWGLAAPGPGNAVSLASTPVFDELWRTFPHTTLTTCGRAVGLPDGQMGNSEVGHLNLGAGSVVRQDLVRIDDEIAAGRLAENPAIRAALEGARRLHLLGLVSDGGVHSSLEHLLALIAIARDAGVGEVFVHAFTDGRDTPPHSGAEHLARVDRAEGARVASVVGRYYAMDRDRRWDRTALAYDLLMRARAPYSAPSGEQSARAAYARGETDEFIKPTVVGDAVAIDPSDIAIAFNFRPDRMRQLVRALAEPGFGEGSAEELPGWPGRGGIAPLAHLTTMTEYEAGWPYPVAFGPEHPPTTLATVLAQAGVKQLHVAETEKYAHVTYFFNGGDEDALPGERRELVPSPRDVPTYDHKPEMSAAQAAAAFVKAWREDEPAFAIINFANADMVGHTGVIEAAVKAVEAVDAGLGEVVGVVRERGGACVVTADHGNAEAMLEPDGSPNTAHSLSPVPLIVTVPGVRLREGILADVAPTVLELLGISQPAGMTAHSLLEGP